MSVHIELTITAPSKKAFHEVSEYCIREVGQPDLDEENLTIFKVVRSHGDWICIKNYSEELGCSVYEDIVDDD